MITYDEAQTILLQQIKTLESERLTVSALNGRTLAESIHAPMALPVFRNSAMDGFAVNTTWINNQERKNFSVDYTLHAGRVRENSFTENSVCAVMTGAYVPSCYDTVIPIEQVIVSKKKTKRSICLTQPVVTAKNIREVGEDINLHECVLNQGKSLGATEQSLLMSLGVESVSVFRKPKVAVLTTGNEVLDFHQKKLPLGMIYNSNAVYLTNKLRELGVAVEYLGIVADDPASLKTTLLKTMDQDFDAIITTGAVSAGEHDFVPAVLRELNINILFHKVKMKPGKPLLLGKTPVEQLFFALPGNPVSAMIGLEFFIEPWLQALMRSQAKASFITTLSHDVISKEGFTCFKKALVDSSQAVLNTKILSGQLSFQIKSLLTANAWVKLSDQQAFYPKGSLVETYYR